MNTNELLIEIAARTEMTFEDVRKIQQELFGIIVEQLKKGGEVKITNFGLFMPFTTKKRPGRNLRTGETITIPSKKRIKFKASKGNKEL